MAIIVIRGNPDDSAGTMNKKCPQMLVAFFRHIHQHLSVATRMLAWNQTQPCSKVAAILTVPLPIAATTAVAVTPVQFFYIVSPNP
jgi:hypothetical protein